MNSVTYLTLREDTLRALREFRLTDALRSLNGQLRQLAGADELQHRYRVLNSEYTDLLSELRAGGGVPRVKAQQYAFLQETYRLTDDLHRYYRFEFACGFVRPEKELDGRVVRHQLLAQDETRPTVRSVFDGQAPNETLFNVLWTAPQWSEEDAEAAQLFLYRETVDAEWRAMAASAVTLRLFASFDDRQFAWLCEAVTQKTDAVLRVRALTGAVLVAAKQQTWLPLFPESQAALKTLVSSSYMRRLAKTLQCAFWTAQETVSFNRHLVKDLLPLIIESRSAFPASVEEVERVLYEGEDLSQEEKNIRRVFMEVARAQGEGMDVNYGIFSRFLAPHPFFREASHWFYEFSPTHREFAHLPEDIDVNAATQAGRIGNTERFGWVKAAELISALTDEVVKKERNMQFTSPFAEANFVFTVDVVGDTEDITRVKGYVRDLFRFSSLYAHRNEQENPFHGDLFLAASPLFSAAFEEEEGREELAEFCLRHKLWNCVPELISEQSTDIDALRKLAFAHYRLKNLKEAARILELALQFDANNYEVLRGIARIYDELEQNEEELTYLVQMEAQKPEDEQLLFMIAVCYARLGLYDLALSYLYKLEYLYPDNLLAKRTKALCLFCLERYTEAEPLFEALLTADVTPLALQKEDEEKQRENVIHVKSGDYYHAAHTAWALGKTDKAIEYYISGLSIKGDTRANANFFDEDLKELRAIGWSEIDFALIRDLINRELEA